MFHHCRLGAGVVEGRRWPHHDADACRVTCASHASPRCPPRRGESSPTRSRVRRDALVLDHPTEHRRGAVGGVAHQAIDLQSEALLDTFDHGPGRLALWAPMRRRGLHVHDDPGLQVDQVVGGVGVERRSVRRSGPTRRWIGQGDVPARLGCIVVMVGGVGTQRNRPRAAGRLRSHFLDANRSQRLVQKRRCVAAMASAIAGTGPITRMSFCPRANTSRHGRSSVGFSAWLPVSRSSSRSSMP
jgi:hypothetical protein